MGSFQHSSAMRGLLPILLLLAHTSADCIPERKYEPGTSNIESPTYRLDRSLYQDIDNYNIFWEHIVKRPSCVTKVKLYINEIVYTWTDNPQSEMLVYTT